eukprot:5212871-Pyramimonas_sp.AAC.1
MRVVECHPKKSENLRLCSAHFRYENELSDECFVQTGCHGGGPPAFNSRLGRCAGGPAGSSTAVLALVKLVWAGRPCATGQCAKGAFATRLRK